MQPRPPPNSPEAPAPAMTDGQPPVREALHALIDTLPDALLLPLCDLLRHVQQELTALGLLLMFL